MGSALNVPMYYCKACRISSLLSFPCHFKCLCYMAGTSFEERCICVPLMNTRSCEMGVGSGNVCEPPLGTSLSVPGFFCIRLVE